MTGPVIIALIMIGDKKQTIQRVRKYYYPGKENSTYINCPKRLAP